MNPEVAAILANTGTITRRDYPHLENAIRHCLAAGHILPVLPGTYVSQISFHTKVASVQAWDRDAVFTGATAARLSWWPELPIDEVTAATSYPSKRKVPGLVLRRQAIDPDLVFEVNGFRLVHPAWSALELSDTIGGTALDEALRRSATSLPALRWALGSMPNRRGNGERRRLLIESRDEPWSELERAAHKLLRAARITGWTADHRIALYAGTRFIDIAFVAARLGIELDSWQHHRSFEMFQDDRAKDRALNEEGWMILRFTHQSLDELVPTLRRILPMRLT